MSKSVGAAAQKSNACRLPLGDSQLDNLPEIRAWLAEHIRRPYHFVYPPKQMGAFDRDPVAIHFDHVGDATFLKCSHVWG